MLQRFKNKEKRVVPMLAEPEFFFQHRMPSTAIAQTQVVTDTNPRDHLIQLPKEGRLEESCRIYVSVLHGCIQKKALAEAKLIHARINQTGCMADILLHNTLLNTYAKCGSMVDARRVFDQMPKRDICSWTVMIAAYARHGTGEEAFSLLNQMQRTGLQPNHFTFSGVLPACAHSASLEQGMKIHREIIIRGFESHLVVANALLDMYAKCGRMENARELFDRIFQRDIVSWNTMVAGYARNGHLDEALNLFQQMPQRDAFSWTAMIAGFSQNGRVGEALKFFKEMPQRTAVSWNAMLAGLAHNGFIDDALKLFKEMPQKTVASWNAMIAGFAQNGYGDKALKCFQEMQLAGVKPDWKTFTSILPGCANLINLEQGVEIHDKIIKSGLQSDAFVVSALVNMYANCGGLHKARELFDKMHQPDVVAWTAMIAGYAQSGFTEEALKLFNKMPKRDAVAWTTMIAGYAQNGLVDEALKLFNEMPRRDAIAWNAMIAGFVQNGFIDEAMNLFEMMPQKNIFSWTAIISGFAQSGCVDEALKHFKEMPERTVASWNAIIAGFSQNGHGEEALRLFQQMQLADVRLYPKTFASILPACANLAALEQGMEIHENIIRSGFESDVTVMNALIDMYGKCGNIKKAHHLFGKMHQQNVVSWTTIIAVYAMHGCGKEAIKLFEQMKLSGINPNHITFVNILSACSHAGLVDEGFQYFRSMIEDYHITPAMEHYRCMVDLLGRAGCLDEAHTFINKMPIKPDASLWSCLLSACRVHNNTELGERIAGYILDFDPENNAPYVLLSNIYAMAGRWDDIEKVRKMMKDRGIKKAPGCSWIEINKQVHAFLMGDK